MSPKSPFRSKPTLAVILVACGCALALGAVVHSRDDTAPAATAPSWEQSLHLIGNRFAECLRKHGHPQIADPVIRSDGRISFGAQDDAVDAAARSLRGTTCLSELMALKDAPPKPPTREDLHRAVLFAQCVRKHGVPDWPDPHPDGTYPLNARLQRAGKGDLMTALQPCGYLNLGEGIRLSPSSRPAPK